LLQWGWYRVDLQFASSSAQLKNRQRQRAEQREVRAPLLSIFKPRVLANTLTACIWMAGGFVAYYSVNALFATHLQKDLQLAPGLVATPIFFANLGLFLSTCGWGWWADRFGRRWAIIIPALIALPLAPLCISAGSPGCLQIRLSGAGRMETRGAPSPSCSNRARAELATRDDKAE
jgi:predicted MFS family arabinose efflux permease